MWESSSRLTRSAADRARGVRAQWACSWRSEVAEKPVLGTADERLHRPRLLRRAVAARARHARLLEEAHHRRRARVGDHVVERAAVGGRALANGLQEDVLAELDHSRHHRGAAGDDDPAREQLLVAAVADHLVDERIDLLDARLDDAGERLAAEH